MSADLVPFEFGSLTVRTVVIDGEPWFVAADVTSALGIANGRDALTRIDKADVGSTDIRSGGQIRKVSTVNESGLYDLILDSRKPEAKAFRRWITSEVLPAIRKTGKYETQPAVPTTFVEALELAVSQARLLEAAAPKVEAFDAYMEADDAIAMGAAANQLGIGRNTMMRKLRDAGVLQRDNRPYQRYAQHFKVVAQSYEGQTATHATYTTYVRPSGVEVIRRVLSGGKGLVSITGGAA